MAPQATTNDLICSVPPPLLLRQMLDVYYKAAKFLPFVNNELPLQRNATYAARFSSIQRLALIKVRPSSKFCCKHGQK